MPLDAQAIATLKTVSTATITTVLLKKGLRNVWIRGAKPIRAGQPRLVGPAFTLRFVPAREDLATPESWSNPRSTRAAIEAMPEGCITVVDAMGITDAGIFVSSPTSVHGPSSSLLSAFGGNQWLRLSSSQLDYRNNSNGGNQLTDYGPGPLPLAFNTYQPNGGPFVSTLEPGSPVPLPAAVWMFGAGVMSLAGLARRNRR